MHEIFKKMIGEGIAELEFEKQDIERSALRAKEKVERVKADMQALAKFAEDLPSKMLEKFSTLLTCEFEKKQGDVWTFADLRLGHNQMSLHGLGRDRVGDYAPGRYRAVVILQKID